jgi:endoglucanase
VIDARIVDAQGQVVQLRGINWFGFETTDHVAHGLWARNWKSMVDQMRDLGFNAVRLPLCPDTLRASTPATIDYGLNPDLAGLDALALLDAVVQYLDARGMYVLLDHHRPDCRAISELWYTPQYAESRWIADLTFLAQRYGARPRVIGVDLKNEPHGAATWGTGNAATDWNAATERAAAAVLRVAPHWLVFVEGIQDNPSCSANDQPFWGENLEPLACTPLSIPRDRLVLSPHTYGPDVVDQPYFRDPTFPGNMAAIWDRRFGQFVAARHAVVLGEFGGKYGEGDPRDVAWQDALVDYLVAKGVRSGFYWAWNPNSGDTGGVLDDDWTSVRTDKLALLRRLWGDASGPAAPTVTLAASPVSVIVGQTTTLTWSSTNATTCTASGAWSGARPPSGSQGFAPGSAGTFTYSLACAGAGGTTTQSVAVTATAAPTVTVLPAKVSVSSDWGAGYCANATVTNSGSARVVWAADIAVNGTVRQVWSAQATSGSATSVRFSGLVWNRELPPGAAAQFGFCADRSGGQVDPPPSVALAVDPSSIAVGQTGTVTWSSTNATSCAASGAWAGAKPMSGTQGVAPTAAGTLTYTLACTGSGGTATRSAVLTVSTAPASNVLAGQVRITNDWGSGFCADVGVTNSTSVKVTWVSDVAVQGTMFQVWNATASGSRGTVRFAGVAWNRELAPGATTHFGFCATR